MDLRVVVWVREFLVGRTQRVRVRGQLYKEIKVTSVVPQWRFGHTAISSVRKWYLEGHRLEY